MNTEIELKLLKEIEELKRKFNILEGKDENQIPTYQYSKIRDADLKKLFDIERNLDNGIFDEWLNNKIAIDNSTKVFLKALIEDNKALIEIYSEEDLKVNFIVPILSKVKFKSYEKKIRGFYELRITYKTSEFILNGTIDFVVSEGLVESIIVFVSTRKADKHSVICHLGKLHRT